MIILNGVKYACEKCVRGHRVRNCNHQNCPTLIPLKRRGRPIHQCLPCHLNRKLGIVKSHTKCSHNNIETSNTNSSASNNNIETNNTNSSASNNYIETNNTDSELNESNPSPLNPNTLNPNTLNPSLLNLNTLNASPLNPNTLNPSPLNDYFYPSNDSVNNNNNNSNNNFKCLCGCQSPAGECLDCHADMCEKYLEKITEEEISSRKKLAPKLKSSSGCCGEKEKPKFARDGSISCACKSNCKSCLIGACPCC